MLQAPEVAGVESWHYLSASPLGQFLPLAVRQNVPVLLVHTVLSSEEGKEVQRLDLVSVS